MYTNLARTKSTAMKVTVSLANKFLYLKVHYYEKQVFSGVYI